MTYPEAPAARAAETSPVAFEPVRLRERECLLVVGADLFRRHALLEAVVAGQEKVVDLFACLGVVHV